MSDTTDTTTTREELTRHENVPLRTRIAEAPRPFLKWAVVLLVLVAIEFSTFATVGLSMLGGFFLGITAFIELVVGSFSGGLASAVLSIQGAGENFIDGLIHWTTGIPHLFSRQFIPNQGHRVAADGAWQGTFLGLEPALAWAVRFILIGAYAIFLAYWLFKGWKVYRKHYRQADWSPTDDMVRRLRGHRWGQFGIIVILLYLTMAIFGSTLAPMTVEENIQSPYSNNIEYFNEETGQVEEVSHGEANFNSKSKGAGNQNVGPMTYDDYGRYHPFGTLPNGRDLFTFMMGGARITMMVSGLAIGIATLISALFAMISAYYGGSIDLAILTTADGVISVPRLLLLIMVSAVFANHWLGKILDGGLLLALIFAFTTWPLLWRTVRGPALQVAQQEWVDAAQSFGQKPSSIMRKHMLPYITGYLLVYASMSTGGIIIGLAALSFLGNGLGINPPTPAWGRAINMGQSYVSGPSWHISAISGVMIVILVTGLNAFGDGIRDAIDPEMETEQGEGGA